MAKASFPNVLEKYVLPYVKSDALVQRWRRGPMMYWQNQSKLCSLLRDNRLWNAFDNSYDRSAYEKCNEFNVDVHADWRQKQSDNQGLCRIYNYWAGDLGVEYDKKKKVFLYSCHRQWYYPH